jgi:hypothetical protein
MLTLRQLLYIATRRSIPPWRLRELRGIFQVPSTAPLSLRSVMNGVGGQKVVCFVEVRDASILKSVHTLAELQAIWRSSVPTKTTWTQLAQILGASGGSIKLLANNWLSAGIAGTTNSLAAVSTVRITNNTMEGAHNIAEAAGAASILLIEIGAIPEPASPFLIFLGATLGVADISFLATTGILEMTSNEPQQPTDPQQEVTIPEVTIVGQPNPDPNSIQMPEVIIYGSTPAGMSPQDINDAPSVDPLTIPDAPPEPPPICPPPVCPGGP